MSASVSTETAKRRAALVAATREAAPGVEPQQKPKSLISTLKRRDAHLLHSDGPGIICCGTPAAAEEGDLKDPRFHKSRNGLNTICLELPMARRTLRHQTPKGRLKFWREGFAIKNLNHTGHRANGSCGCAQKYKRIPEPGVPIAATGRHGFTTLDSKSVPHIHRIAALALHRRRSRLLYVCKLGSRVMSMLPVLRSMKKTCNMVWSGSGCRRMAKGH